MELPLSIEYRRIFTRESDTQRGLPNPAAPVFYSADFGWFF